MIRALSTLFALSWSVTALAQPVLDLPIDCTPGETCYVQNYVDRDPGPGARDYTCSGLSYDGHKGTDFGLPSLAAMEEGVTVLASADGRVRGVRDGMIDKLYTAEEDARIDGRDCGNGVVIEHGDGWETQYCHMQQGSIRVQSGQEVKAGDALGLVGLSGRTQFPHLHISVRQNGETVDPFTPEARVATCGTEAAETMWSRDLAYMPGAILSSGFADAVPDYAAIKAGTAALATMSANAPAIVLWGFAFGGREGDEMVMTIDGPSGRVAEGRQKLDKNQAQFFRASGKRLRAPLDPGLYTGTTKLMRAGGEVSSMTVEMTVD